MSILVVGADHLGDIATHLKNMGLPVPDPPEGPEKHAQAEFTDS